MTPFGPLLVAALVLAACGGGGGASSDDDRWSQLAPGGTVDGPGGSRLLAPAGTIEAPVEVRLERGNVPADELADEEVASLGTAVSLRARARAAALGEDGFVLELPLPSGADPSTVGIAIYLDASQTANHVDLAEPPEGPLLDIVEADVDVGAGVVRLDLSLLGEAPSVVQLVDGAEFVQVTPLETQAHGDGFVYVCRSKDLDAVCNTHSGDVHPDIVEAHDRFAAMGFAQPRLRTNSDGRYKIYLKPFKLSDKRKTCHVDEDGNGRFTARYNFPLSKITLCVGGGEIDDDGWNDARGDNAAHEMFHAVQYGYGRVRARPMQMWSVESTANLAEASTDAQLIRRPSTPRPVDVALDLNFIDKPKQSDGNQYRAQDFFAFLGESIAPGQGLAYLTDVFEEGVTPPRVSNAIASFGDVAIQDLSDAYWTWARNQTFEKTVRTVTDGGADHPRGGACVLLDGVADPHRIFMTDGSTPATYAATLPPLTSAVIEVNVTAGDTFAEEIVYQIVRNGSGLRAAFYDPADCLNPRIDPIGGLFTVPPSATGTRYLLVSNTEYRQGRTRDFEFEAFYGQIQPGVRIVEPAAGTTIDETERVTLRAEGVQGVLPDDARLLWGYVRGDGSEFTIGNALVDQTIETPLLCDGTYPITVEVLQGPDAFLGAKDTVDLTVVDSEPPRPACEPTVTIVTPDDGASFPSGESIDFEAVFDDADDRTDDPVHPIVWREDGPGSPVLAQNTPSFSTDALEPGTYDVWVSYGSAEDTITIEVLDTDNASPNPVIGQPQDDASLVYSDYTFDTSGVIIPAGGIAYDPDEGFLDAAAHAWSYRLKGTTSWQYEATGIEVELRLPFVGSKDVWEIRLTATDSEGLEGHDVHTIVMTTPAQ